MKSGDIALDTPGGTETLKNTGRSTVSWQGALLRPSRAHCPEAVPSARSPRALVLVVLQEMNGGGPRAAQKPLGAPLF